MKILNRKQFLNLPNGILYAKYKPMIFGHLEIKEDSFNDDFCYQDLVEIDCDNSEEWIEVLEEGTKKGTSIPLDFDCTGRDGLFDDNQLFAVFEKKDVVDLIKRLQKTIPNYPEKI